MSAHLQWLITRDTSSFLLKKRNVKQPFNIEPLHLTNRHCYKFSSLVHRNAIGIEPSKEKNGQGFVVVQKRKHKQFKPQQTLKRTALKSGARRSLHLLRNMIVKGGYRKDCKSAALKRASAVIRAGKPRVAKKTKAVKKTD